MVLHEGDADDHRAPAVAAGEPLVIELEAFALAVRGGPPPVADGRHGAAVTRVLEAAARSAAQDGAPVRPADLGNLPEPAGP